MNKTAIPSANRFRFRAWMKKEFSLPKASYDTFTLDELMSGKYDFNKYENWCESTGLTDKNGKEIWEGDVVREKWPQGHEDYQVVWLKSEWAMKVVHEENEYNCGFPNKSVIVIGNVYQNPKLLPTA